MSFEGTVHAEDMILKAVLVLGGVCRARILHDLHLFENGFLKGKLKIPFPLTSRERETQLKGNWKIPFPLTSGKRETHIEGN